MSEIKHILLLLGQKERRQAIALFFGILVAGLLEVLGVASIVPFIAVVLDPNIIHKNAYFMAIYDFFKFDNDNQFFIALSVAVFVVIIFSNVFTSYLFWLLTYFAGIQKHRLSMKLLRAYLSQPYVFFLDRNTAELGKNILVEADRVVSGVLIPIMNAIGKAVIAFFLFILLLFVDWVVAITATIIFIGAYGLIYKLVSSRLHHIGLLVTKVTFNRFKIATESLSAIKDIKLRGAELEHLGRCKVPSKQKAQYTAQAALITQFPRYALEAVAFGGIVLIVLYLKATDQGSSYIISVLALYAMAGYRLLPALQHIYQGISQVRFNYPILKEMAEDLTNIGEGFENPTSGNKAFNLQSSIELKNVSFQYPNANTKVLKDVNLQIKSNTTVGIVGSTGSGKTTLIDIVLGLLPLERGRLIVDGIDITGDNFQAWRKGFGYVPQSIYISDDTIERNIAFCVKDTEIEFEKIVRASKIAELDGFVESLQDGYKTTVGERGIRLSGGERQRIGIARALYHEPDVLVFDEATSSLDGLTESIIMSTIHNLAHRKTIIIIAHRLSTVRECDVIHILEKGAIIDSGKYDELISRNVQLRMMAKAGITISE